MIKLTDLLNEVNVAPIINKPELINQIAEYDIYLLSALTYSNSDINEFLGHYGYNSMEEYIEDVPGEEAIKLVKLYFKHIKPGEIHRVVQQSEPIAGYKMVRSWSFYDDEMDDLIILTKF